MTAFELAMSKRTVYAPAKSPSQGSYPGADEVRERGMSQMTHSDAALDALWTAGLAAIRAAAKSHEYIELAGMHYHSNEVCNGCDDADCCGTDPYKEIEDILQLLRKQNAEMKTHRHKWNDDHRCSICGADGLA